MDTHLISIPDFHLHAGRSTRQDRDKPGEVCLGLVTYLVYSSQGLAGTAREQEAAEAVARQEETLLVSRARR